MDVVSLSTRDATRCVVSAEFFAESLEGEAKYGENALKHGKIWETM